MFQAKRSIHMEVQKLKQLIPQENSKFLSKAGEGSLGGWGSGQEEARGEHKPSLCKPEEFECYSGSRG